MNARFSFYDISAPIRIFLKFNSLLSIYFSYSWHLTNTRGTAVSDGMNTRSHYRRACWETHVCTWSQCTVWQHNASVTHVLQGSHHTVVPQSAGEEGSVSQVGSVRKRRDTAPGSWERHVGTGQGRKHSGSARLAQRLGLAEGRQQEKERRDDRVGDRDRSGQGQWQWGLRETDAAYGLREKRRFGEWKSEGRLAGKSWTS